MRKDEFYAKITPLDAGRLQKMLWELYWRGGKELRERIEALLNPEKPKKRSPELPVGEFLLGDVEDFVSLARSGAYMGGTREVSRNERSKWRVTFRRFVKDAGLLLEHAIPEYGAPALEALIDLACETKEVMYFHSEDPVAAMRLVVSEQAQLLWKSYLAHDGFAAFARQASAQLIRWESAHSWTVYGEGWVAERETTLASVLVQMLKGHDAWVEFTDAYLVGLDDVIPAPTSTGGHRKTSWQDDRRRTRALEKRARNLAEWNELVLDHLHGTDAADRLNRLVRHPALKRPERTFLEARLAYLRGDQKRAQKLLEKCLKVSPRRRDFLAFADQIGLPSAGR
ncbi:MAG: hypothetical protein U9N00_02935 [Candidatus Bipolaricaulota bacterium]|nr:hypothetical protein [Candidatus Bipolaricaulota bacterium]